MKTKLINLLFSIRSSYWFVPSLMAVLSIALSFVMITLDDIVEDKWMQGFGWLYASGPEGARAVLGAIAGSMIGVAGVVFSITIVTLTLASSQFGPRLLHNFMRDIGNQIVLGTFIATFIYCLLILRTVQGFEDHSFVPSLSVAFGVLLAVLSLGVLIYFIQHVSDSIQASNVIAAVSQDIDDTIERLFPGQLGHRGLPSQEPRKAHDLPAGFEDQANPVSAMRRGYLQAIDSDGLLHIASEKDLLLRLEYRPGHFVIPGSALVRVWPGSRLDEQLTRQINRLFVLGRQRTHQQDPGFAFSQLVEIAVRALSPGINDPFTAVTCIEWMSAGLCQLAERDIPSPYRYDEHHALRVIAPQVTFADIADQVFTGIRQYSRSSIMVTFTLLETIAAIAAYVQRDEDRMALLEQAIMIECGSQDGLPEERDRRQVEVCYQAALRALEEQTPGPHASA